MLHNRAPFKSIIFNILFLYWYAKWNNNYCIAVSQLCLLSSSAFFLIWGLLVSELQSCGGKISTWTILRVSYTFQMNVKERANEEGSAGEAAPPSGSFWSEKVVSRQFPWLLTPLLPGGHLRSLLQCSRAKGQTLTGYDLGLLKP